LIAGGVPLLGAGALLRAGTAGGHSASMQGHEGHAGHDGGHANFRGGVAVDHVANGFDPHAIVRDFDWGTTSRLPNGRVLREWKLDALDKEIEIMPGERTVYEFDALPAGVHLYHCHVRPLAEHIAKGLYGAFIVDPSEPREDADELVMVMNGFDTNFDRANEVYAANTIGFAYMDKPIEAKVDQLVRVYLVNVLEYDLINSFHLHGNLFNYFPTGTGTTPSELTDTVMLCQGQRGILEWRFPYPGKYMFHAHQSEFTELGWQGFFEVT
jgi:FtsP/CotA-like multicopper oxidase with cupredoxin domain